MHKLAISMLCCLVATVWTDGTQGTNSTAASLKCPFSGDYEIQEDITTFTLPPAGTNLAAGVSCTWKLSDKDKHYLSVRVQRITVLVAVLTSLAV